MGISGRALAALGCALGFAASARAQSAPRHVWSHQSGAEGWIGKVVSVGDQGHQVFTRFEGYGSFARLFSAQDDQTAEPLWQAGSDWFGASARGASADGAALHAEIRYVQSDSSAPRHPVVSLYGSGSSVPIWQHTLPQSVSNPRSDIHVDRAGQRIVAWFYDWSQLKTRVLVYGTGSATPLSETLVATIGEPVEAAMSCDGTTLAFLTPVRLTMVALPSGAILQQSLPIGTAGPALALSSAGQRLVQAASSGTATVLRRQGNAWTSWFSDDVTGATCSTAAFSDDGATLALGWSAGGLVVRARVWDLSGVTPVLALDETVTGAGAWQNVARDIALSGDGERLAMGLSGDQAGLAPEVLAWARASGSRVWSRVLSFDLPGSVNDIDLSADGRSLAVASKAIHMNVTGGGGRIDLFDLGGSDLELAGLPRAGATVQVRHHARPGTDAVLLVAPHGASVPTPFGTVGTLWLERVSMSVAGAGRVAPDGTLTHTVLLNGAPGETRAFQGLSLAPRALSRDWVRVTLLP